MFENCQSAGKDSKCSEVAEKLAYLFGWRQTYKVEKLQRSLTMYNTHRGAKEFVVKTKPPDCSVTTGETVKKEPGKTFNLDVPDEEDKSSSQEFKRNRLQKSYLYLPPCKSADSWVAVQSLQTSDGGILDPDDRLNDVVDDREQIVATFSDGDGPHHGGGDGASGSSVGTGSPDIFQGEGKYYQPPSDIEVTGDQLVANALQVRRGSEPALNQLEGPNGVPGSVPGPPVSNQANKRWSAAPIILDVDDATENMKNERSKVNGYAQPEWTCHEEEEKTLMPPSKFQRDGSNRLSMQFLPEEIGLKWMDRASHVRGGSNRSSHSSLQRDHKRREPLGQANSTNSVPSKNSEFVIEEGNLENLNTEYVILRNEGGPLGIHVVPDYDSEGRDRGLLVQGIEPGGRVHKDGRLAIFDRIIEINGSNLLNEPFQKVQEIFKNSLSSGELRLRVIKHKSAAPNSNMRHPPPPIYPVDTISNENMVEGHQRTVNCSTKVATVSPTKKLLGGATAANILQTANTRKMGKRIDLELLKGPSGLGFSITTRDNPAGGKCPIYIKNILPQGAAVDDGRLRPGDRLLQVNDIEMTGKTQPEAVAILRQAPTGSIVKISVSRQEDVHCKEESIDEKDPRVSKHERIVGENIGKPVDVNSESDKYGDDSSRASTLDSMSRKIQKPPRNLDESQIFPWRHREILTFDIPVHDTEKAGLGVSVKGKTSANHSTSSSNSPSQSVDLGIFVKSVINGGAASRDGRLKTNDQLLNVNGKSLLNQSNANAMETLRRAMLYMEGPKPGVITLTIARRVSSPGGREGSGYLTSSGSEICRSDSEGVTPDQSVASEASDSTVIFLPSHDNTFKSDRLNDSHHSTGSHRSQKFSSRNPVIDRLTGHNPGAASNALRNESYYRATHETTWNITNMVNPGGGGKLNSPTVNPVAAEPVLIEEDYQSSPNPVNVREPPRRLQDNYKNIDSSVTGSGQSISTHGDVTYASQLSLDESAAGFSRDGIGRQSMSEKRHATLDAKNTDTYRRNKKMREERQQNTQPETVRQNKISNKIAEIRQELLEPGRALVRPGSAESIAMSVTDCHAGNEPRGRLDIGPALGMKKSSSLESLQTMVQEVQMAEDPDPAYTYRNTQGAVRVIRGRGCNESFRAAVDRSYEAPLGLRNHMETPVSEDEGYLANIDIDDQNVLGRGTPRQSSMNAMRDPKLKHNKKKASLLKGIGSMFRFGKHRKTIDSEYQVGMEEEDGDEMKKDESEEKQKEDARIAAQEEHEKIQEQYRKLIMRQHQDNQFHSHVKNDVVPNNNYSDQKYSSREDEANRKNNMNYAWRSNEGNDVGKDLKESSNRNIYPAQYQRVFDPEPNRKAEMDQRTRNRSYDMTRDREVEKLRKFSLDSRNTLDENKEEFQESSPQTRTERIHQLRAKHQKKHVERKGQYPFEEREEKLEQAIRQRLDDPKTHFRSGSYDIYGEMGRPGSRVGITDPARFSHYVNYEEIQQHLNACKDGLSNEELQSLRDHVVKLKILKEIEKSRKKQHYHSQRRDNRELHQRPVSNFYEYESVQSVMRTHQNSHQVQGGKRTSQQPWQDSDSLPRRFENDGGKINASSLPRRIDLEEFSSSPSVKKTVNYLNNLSSSNSAPPGNFHYGRTKKEEPRSSASNSRTRGPYISQITIKENPNES